MRGKKKYFLLCYLRERPLGKEKTDHCARVRHLCTCACFIHSFLSLSSALIFTLFSSLNCHLFISFLFLTSFFSFSFTFLPLFYLSNYNISIVPKFLCFRSLVLEYSKVFYMYIYLSYWV